jgi:CRP-like cAMP-binding protein
MLALHKMGVPRVLAKRVLAFQRYENTMHADNIAHKAFHGLSSNLMQELRLCTFRKLVLQAPFLREQSFAVISFIADSLFDAVYLPSDFIVRFGDRGRELFFVRRGEARAYLGVKTPSGVRPPVWGKCSEVATFKAGSYFGELAMLTGAARGSYVMATTYCICSVLPYSAVESLVEHYPEAFTSLVQTMLKMYKQSGTQKLTPECSWKEMSMKLVKKYDLHSDESAFNWFRGHDEKSDLDDLTAKAFDKALQRMKIPLLDRRIYWSELDTDASGGISFDEFKGKMYFTNSDSDDDRQESISRRQSSDMESRRGSKRQQRGSVDSCGSGIDGGYGSERVTENNGNLSALCAQLLHQNQELVHELKKITGQNNFSLSVHAPPHQDKRFMEIEDIEEAC